MNSLSWFLYLAEVLPQLAHNVTVLSTILFFALTIVSIVRTAAIADGSGMSLSARKNEYRGIWGFWGKTAVPLLVLGLSMTLIPSKETIYMIAGSEAGEAVVTSETGQEILNDIKEVIQFQLSELKGENISPTTP